MIHFEHVRKQYLGGREALKGVSFAMDQGEMAFLTGRSGAGKSTLLKLVALLERPTSGSIVINNINLAQIRRNAIAEYRRRVGVVFQSPMLLYDRTVFDNVALPLLVSGFLPTEIKRRVQAALDQVGLLDRQSSNPVSLSGGEQQRVGIARAVVSRPAILLADEPTGNLDPKLSEEIMQLFERFNHIGVTVLIASHDIELIKRLDYRTLHLEDGAMAEVVV
ncbi:MAG: cell division ATP-binding protein FtsE [Gammaproteobacteria bacterium]|nr:cell division ATP-binding protein FtsE [Gammaproteobacteria bacterium]MDH5691619.1 cell division ATP-binding protein FtsE [Gammaproteobacteria bacterium]